MPRCLQCASAWWQSGANRIRKLVGPKVWSERSRILTAPGAQGRLEFISIEDGQGEALT